MSNQIHSERNSKKTSHLKIFKNFLNIRELNNFGVSVGFFPQNC